MLEFTPTKKGRRAKFRFFFLVMCEKAEQSRRKPLNVVIRDSRRRNLRALRGERLLQQRLRRGGEQLMASNANSVNFVPEEAVLRVRMGLVEVLQRDGYDWR